MTAKSFREGESYFRLSFLDRAMTRPVVDTLIFLGMNLSDEDSDSTWYFQDAHSYNAIGPAHESTTDNDAEVHCYIQSDVEHLYDLNGLIGELKKLSSRP